MKDFTSSFRAFLEIGNALADNSLIDDDAASRFLAGYPDPDLP